MNDTKETYRAMLAVAHKALQQIANCPEQDLARYCAKVDSIALDALIALDFALEDMEAAQ